MKNITVLYGNYGSGKTELALSIALDLREKYEDVMLVDLDIVNPYFRSSEHRKMLSAKGIRVIAPAYASTGVDLPTIPPGVLAAFKGGYAVFDVGGDTAGAVALGSLNEYFSRSKDKVEVLFVVNTKRPFQESTGRLQESLKKIEHRSRLRADGLVLNSNLGYDTTGEELVQGYGIIKELESVTGIPLKYISGTKEALKIFLNKCPDYEGETIELDILMRPEWLKP